MGVYHELDISLGCWISNYPEGCDFDPVQKCQSPFIAMIFAGYPFFVLMLVIIVNNFLISCFVYRTTNRAKRRYSFRSTRVNAGLERTKAVAVQAFLYVAAFLVTYAWTVVLRFIEAYTLMSRDEAKLFPILVLQSTFAPMLGVFNLFIYIRPRYLHRRLRFPKEPRLWTFGRVLRGKPTAGSSTNFALFSCALFRRRRSSRFPEQFVVTRDSKEDDAKQVDYRVKNPGEIITTRKESETKKSIEQDPETAATPLDTQEDLVAEENMLETQEDLVSRNPLDTREDPGTAENILDIQEDAVIAENVLDVQEDPTKEENIPQGVE